MDNLLKTITLPNGSVLHIGGEGHTIVNSSGTQMTQRSKIQFIGATLTDDATNNKTVVSVDVTNQITQSETKPVSSGAVYTAIGNIETLLASI